jgi:predicted permease
VRAALGASRIRILRQLLTESVLLSFGGGIIGTLLAVGSFAFLKHLIPADLSSTVNLRVSFTVLAFTFVASLASAALFGLAPAAQSAKVDLNSALKDAGRGSGGLRHRGIGRALVVGEVALSLMLLTGAGLLLESFWKLRHVDPGFQSDYVLTAGLDLAEARYRDWGARTQFVRRVLEGVKTLPGVESVGLTSVLPMTWKGGTGEYIPEGANQGRGGFFSANERAITPGYLETMRIPLIRGRLIDDRDREDAPLVAVVNLTMAQKLWPNQDAIGKRFKAGTTMNGSPWIQVVGLVGDVKQMGLDQPPRQEVYFPYLQTRGNYMWPNSFAIRTRVDSLSMANSARRVIASVDPEEPLIHVMAMGDILDRETSQSKVETVLLVGLAALALAMACVGIYGVMATMVTHRTCEMGIRMALGAQRNDVLALVLRNGMVLALMGVSIGVGAALGLTRFMRSLLFGVSPTDPIVLFGVSLLLIVVALTACFIPARRAASIDPMRALRTE